MCGFYYLVRFPYKLNERDFSNKGLSFLAVGSSRGALQIYNMGTSELAKEFFVVNMPIQGIEWINEDEILIVAHPAVTSLQALVRNEICILDLITGNIRSVRKCSNEEPPIRVVKVSASKLYFLCIFRSGPPEVWNIAEGKPLIWHRPR